MVATPILIAAVIALILVFVVITVVAYWSRIEPFMWRTGWLFEWLIVGPVMYHIYMSWRRGRMGGMIPGAILLTIIFAGKLCVWRQRRR